MGSDLLATTPSIGRIVRNAVVFDFKRHGAQTMDPESLLGTVEDLFDLLGRRRVAYVLVGGIALLQYVAGRNTEDIDLIVALSSLKALPEIALTQQDEYFAAGEYVGLQIDFLLTQNPLFDTVRRHHTTDGQFGERSIRVATVEGLLLLKLYALPSLYRQGNFARLPSTKATSSRSCRPTPRTWRRSSSS